MSPPAFSVVIPTYNRPQLLSRAVASVLAQTLGDFELLVVDDASAQDVSGVLAAFGDPRIRLVRRPENGGPAASVNTGIRLARSELISLLGDDDEYLPGFLEATRAALAAAGPEVGFSWSGVRIVEDTHQGERLVREVLWQPKFTSRREAYRGFLRSRYIGTNCGVTVRRSCFDDIGLFHERLRKGEDTDFFIRAVARYDFVVVPEILVKVHHHPGPRATSFDRDYLAAYLYLIDKHREEVRSDRGLRATLHYKAGWLAYHSGDRTLGRKLLLQALASRPLHGKAWLALALFESLRGLAPRVHLAASRTRRAVAGKLGRRLGSNGARDRATLG